MLYDLTSKENALESLAFLCEKDVNEIDSYLNTINCDNIETMYESFLDKFNIDVRNINIENIDIKSIHVTTCNDDGISISENGLLNLRKAIETPNTSLYKFLLNIGMTIDLENKTINIKHNNFSLLDNRFKEIYRKFYEDYGITGFHYSQTPLNYEGDVKNQPEIISNFNDIFSIHDNKLKNKWKNEFNQCYIVEYKSNINNFIDYISVEWLIQESIRIITNNALQDLFSYLNRDYNVPPSDILDLKNII